MPNQWKPLSPLEQIKPVITRMWKTQCTDTEILQEVHKHINTNQYGIGLMSLRAIQKSLGFLGTHQQGHMPESIQKVMVELQQIYPNAGTCEMISLLFHEKQMSVTRSVIQEYFLLYEPELICQHKACRLRCCHFWAAGVNDLWAVDQHNKWLRFRLALHTGIKLFSGKFLWIRVWHSDHNPQLILTYFLDAAEEQTHNDPSMENFGITNTQSMLRQWHQLDLVGMLQHRWMQHKKNIMPKIMWSQLHHQFTPGFESILEEGLSTDDISRLVFWWLFIPWLQQELDVYWDHVNNTAKHHD
ncbi:hypothetical protein EDC04DRAFT_2870054 [Pisolithus marmoratus]|nr:hypothetical protein EDC04DRAFT_2870054 [Pisolithus marmoratus]